MEQSGQQWDFPNGWPPLQSMIVVGLENTGNPRAKAIAFQLAQRWLSNNYEAYQQSMPNAMFEKVVGNNNIDKRVLKLKYNYSSFSSIVRRNCCRSSWW